MKNNVKRSNRRDLASLRAGCRKVIGRICPRSSSIFGPSNLVFLSDLTWLPGPGPVFASVGDYLWSPTLCCSSSNRRRAFSSRMGAFIRSSSWGSGSRRGPSAPGWEPSSSAAAGGLYQQQHLVAFISSSSWGSGSRRGAFSPRLRAFISNSSWGTGSSRRSSALFGSPSSPVPAKPNILYNRESFVDIVCWTVG